MSAARPKLSPAVHDMFQLGETLSALEAGKLVIYPTDTVWALGCDATNAEAVARVAAVKERPEAQGFVSLVDSLEMLKRYVPYVHPRLQTLLAHHARPLTMIYPDVQGLAAGVTAADGSAAIRIASDAYCEALIGSFGKPLVSTSANLRGSQPPPHYGAISSDVLRRADHVVKYRQRDTEPAEPSVIARWNDSNEIEPIRR